MGHKGSDSCRIFQMSSQVWHVINIMEVCGIKFEHENPPLLSFSNQHDEKLKVWLVSFHLHMKLLALEAPLTWFIYVLQSGGRIGNRELQVGVGR
jgi:hypothetical protein